MAGNWLAARRSEVAADRILDAAADLFAERDAAAVGMLEIAKAAGCSRATLYRYFENRDALYTAFVNREAYRLFRQLSDEIRGVDDPGERLVAGIAAALRMVRGSPALVSWFAMTEPPIGGEMAERSEVIKALTTAFVGSLGQDDPAAVDHRARWLVRVITSLLIFPGADETDEKRMLQEFVVPVVARVCDGSRRGNSV
jgi:AcrR family transcriptional regulator